MMDVSAPIIMLDGTVADLAGDVPIDFAHVAASLSKTARFNGRHRGAALSVAQHCVMGADALFAETGDAVLAGYFLLHDAHEYLLGDICRPAAVWLDLIAASEMSAAGFDGPCAGIVRDAIAIAKARLDAAILDAARLPPVARMPLYARLVAEMDERMCFAEAQTLYGVKAIPLVRCDLPPPKLTQALKPWAAMKAEEAYLQRLERYLGIVARPA